MKRTYTLPRETVERFERRVGPGKRSRLVKDLVERWVDEEERAELRRQIIEGCRDMAEANLEIERELHPLEEEVAREFGD